MESAKHPDSVIQNDQMKRYFDTLPAYVQVTIQQSGLVPASLNDLKNAAENLMR